MTFLFSLSGHGTQRTTTTGNQHILQPCVKGSSLYALRARALAPKIQKSSDPLTATLMSLLINFTTKAIYLPNLVCPLFPRSAASSNSRTSLDKQARSQQDVNCAFKLDKTRWADARLRHRAQVRVLCISAPRRF